MRVRDLRSASDQHFPLHLAARD